MYLCSTPLDAFSAGIFHASRLLLHYSNPEILAQHEGTASCNGQTAALLSSSSLNCCKDRATRCRTAFEPHWLTRSSGSMAEHQNPLRDKRKQATENSHLISSSLTSMFICFVAASMLIMSPSSTCRTMGRKQQAFYVQPCTPARCFRILHGLRTHTCQAYRPLYHSLSNMSVPSRGASAAEGGMLCLTAHQGDGAAILRLRRHVADNEAVRTAGEPPVRDQRAVLQSGRCLGEGLK